MADEPADFTRLIRMPEMKRIFGVSRMTIYRMVDRGELPKQHRITKRAIGWPESAVAACLERTRSAPS